MHRGPMRVSSAMTKGPSLASVEEVRADDHAIGSSRAWSEVIRRAPQVAARPACEPRLDALIDDVSRVITLRGSGSVAFPRSCCSIR
jgi:hypothetical protein